MFGDIPLVQKESGGSGDKEKCGTGEDGDEDLALQRQGRGDEVLDLGRGNGRRSQGSVRLGAVAVVGSGKSGKEVGGYSTGIAARRRHASCGDAVFSTNAKVANAHFNAGGGAEITPRFEGDNVDARNGGGR